MSIDKKKNPLYRFMKKNDITQYQLANKLQISRVTVINLLSETPKSSFNLKTLKRVSDVTNIPLNKICNWYVQFL